MTTAIAADRLRELLSFDTNTGIFTWRSNRGNYRCAGWQAGNIQLDNGYSRIVLDRRRYYAHRLAWFYVHGVWPEFIDHINGVRLDNRIDNLRNASRDINAQNLRAVREHSKTHLLGVHPRRDKFLAQINVGNERYYLGQFDTPEEGHEAYISAKRKLHEGCTI